jgi:hypothetical protein
MTPKGGLNRGDDEVIKEESCKAKGKKNEMVKTRGKNKAEKMK